MPVGSQSFEAVDTTPIAATSTKITNLAMATPSTEVSHAFTSNLKQVIIRSRTIANLQYSFTSGESGTKYITVKRGITLELVNLDFTGVTLYVQADKATTLEIQELF